ncbi:M23 family metallopeptidase [Paraglaciecola psychrophila]|uniref:Peptidase M23 n=1 Tax=Paraglaciecola psychrophila 170 TaxID=1129794 RepID=K6Z1Z3_9ALTE|nr:M23 family metallopeptidase [Paraglaciecola psychrophila]AGH43036.1 peptidase M23 [Paraglaciecola psychrophila 170]GAC39064.1 membrane protein [Paraglaciecola psychrophila 170]
MKLTLLFRSNNARFVLNIDKQKLLLALLAISGLFLVSSRSTHSPEENIARIQHAKTGFVLQAEEVSLLKTTTEQRMTGVMLKLADMQNQIQRLDALGSRLVEQAMLNPDEFSFNQMPSMGGPLDSSSVEIQVQDELLSKITSMLEKIQNKAQELNILESIMLSDHIREESRVEGKPISTGWLSSYYGIRKDPFSGLPAMHKGLDFAGKEGEPVVATGAGIITWSGSRYGYGELVEIDHGDGLVTRYGHNKVLNVKIGDVVTKGQTIAEMGNTGRSTGAHVHYEVIRKGKQQDPLPYVYRKSS